MADKKAMAAAAALGIGAASVGGYILLKNKSTTIPPNMTVTATLSTTAPGTLTLDSNGQVTVPFEITVLGNGSPLSGVTTFLFENSTQQGSSETTDANGNAKYTFTFTTPGTYLFYGEVQ
jgi:plastocyanin